ncbi:MAG TPA: DUF1016 N-terminal domain-containing protein [Pirellulales bacterium]|nr:DUF1016 N-terminal domain-containing protein [Pirellulales bacterium]
MSKPPRKGKRTPQTKALVSAHAVPVDFNEVLRLIEAARARAFAAINQELVGLYWQIGEYISRKLESARMGRRSGSAIGRPHCPDAPRLERFHPAQPVSDAAVLRDLCGRRKSITAGDTIALDP